MSAFSPRYILQHELEYYGLPSQERQANILSIVESASSYIDEYTGRTDGDGNGSLVYTTYSERLFLPAGRNVFRVSFRPLVVVDANTANNLAASGQNYYTGFVPNANTANPFISISGRYSYGRRDRQYGYPDLNYGANVMQIAALWGGPPIWTGVDTTMIDFDSKNGEVWIPAGLFMGQYTEVVCTYNSGYDPRDMPVAVKHACAALIRNLLGRAGGTTGLRGLTSGRVNAQFTEDLCDVSVQKWLSKFMTVVAM